MPPELAPLSKDCVDSSPGVDSSASALMGKRTSDEEHAAVLKAGLPPRSDDYPDDDKAWHDAQDSWLARWQPQVKLPLPNDKKRRKDWDALSKKATRHHAAAVEARRARKQKKLSDPSSAATAPAAAPAPTAPRISSAAPTLVPDTAPTEASREQSLREAGVSMGFDVPTGRLTPETKVSSISWCGLRFTNCK